MKKGFTLLEILLVIAAIGILAAIVIVAINPNRQLAQVRDAERRSDINSLYKALEQYVIDNGAYPPEVEALEADQAEGICAEGVSLATCQNDNLVYLGELVPTYLAAIPESPQTSGNETNYEIWKSVGGQVGISAYDTETDIIASIGATPKIGAARVSAGLDCDDILEQNSSAGDGEYWIRPEDFTSAFRATCDMTTDGGGWTLVLNYNHLGGTNPALRVYTDTLPLLNSITLGVNEANTNAWGHAGNSLMNAFSISELRFYGISSGHSRVLHFKTSRANCITYFQTGAGNCAGINTNNTPLSSHTAFLPSQINMYYSNRGDFAMTDFTFFRSGVYHWGMLGSGYRWELDDYPNSAARSTHHQVWIR